MEMELKKCPKCKCTYTEPPAISRADNKTEICSNCGMIEALVNCLFPRVKLLPNEQTTFEEDMWYKLTHKK